MAAEAHLRRGFGRPPLRILPRHACRVRVAGRSVAPAMLKAFSAHPAPALGWAAL